MAAAHLPVAGERGLLEPALDRSGRSSKPIAILLQYGFTAYHYDPISRLLAPQDGMSDQNTIYVRDPDWVQSRLKTASAFKVFDREVA